MATGPLTSRKQRYSKVCTPVFLIDQIVDIFKYDMGNLQIKASLNCCLFNL